MFFLKDCQKQQMLWKKSFILQTITVIMVFNVWPGSHSKTIYSSKLSRNKMKIKAKKKALQKRNNFQLIKTKYFSIESVTHWMTEIFGCLQTVLSESVSHYRLLHLISILVLSLIMALSASRWAVNRHVQNKFYSSSFKFCSYIY